MELSFKSSDGWKLSGPKLSHLLAPRIGLLNPGTKTKIKQIKEKK